MDKTVSQEKPKRRQIDWEAIEREYRAGRRTLRDIGDEFGVSNPAIVQKAKRNGWERDLSAKIAAKAEALVSKQAISSEVSKATAITERLTIETNAQMLADKVINQREDVKRLRNTINTLTDELDDLNESKEQTLSDRVRITKALAETTKIAIELERRILKLDDFSADESISRVVKVELVPLV